jgi:hypothetical protein
MKSHLRRRVFDAFMLQMKQLFPEFHLAEINPLPNSLVFTWNAGPECELRIMVPTLKREDAFRIEIGWGRKPFSGWRTLPLASEPYPPEYGLPLPEIWSTHTVLPHWEVSAEPMNPNYWSFSSPEAAVGDAIAKFVKYGAPFFARVIEREAPAAVGRWKEIVDRVSVASRVQS